VLTARTFLLRFLATGSFEFAKSCAKNCIKTAIGRPSFFSFQNVFFKLYVLHLFKIRPIRKITCIGLPGEGAGSQTLMIMRAITFAQMNGLTYVHHPFTNIAHADRPVEEWANAWETQFNLGMGEVFTDGDSNQVVNFAYNLREILPLFGLERGDLTLGLSKTLPEFRKKYYCNKVARKNDVLKICVHVRRGDVTFHGMPGMWTATSVIRLIIADIRRVLDTHRADYQICIFSQGNPGDFAALNTDRTKFFINSDPIWTMRELIEADIFVMAKSSFSYVAALISDGIKLAPSDGFPPLSNWVVVDPSGRFDSAFFEQQLLNLAAPSPVS